MDKKLIRRLKSCLDKAEAGHVSALDEVDGVVLDGGDATQALTRMCAAVKAARQHADDASALCGDLLDGDDEEDEDKSFNPMRRKNLLDELDRVDVGAVARMQPIREVGGAFLRAQMLEDEQRRLDAFWRAR